MKTIDLEAQIEAGGYATKNETVILNWKQKLYYSPSKKSVHIVETGLTELSLKFNTKLEFRVRAVKTIRTSSILFFTEDYNKAIIEIRNKRLGTTKDYSRQITYQEILLLLNLAVSIDIKFGKTKELVIVDFDSKKELCALDFRLAIHEHDTETLHDLYRALGK